MNNSGIPREFHIRMLRYIHENDMTEKGCTVLAGVSGGADSVCLLTSLYSLREALCISVEAVHVHHGIRGASADADAAFVSALADSLQIPCRVIHVDVPSYAAAHNLSTEDAARVLRYEAFREASAGREHVRVAVAHNLNDQAETVLFRLFRGSGARGLSGMSPVCHEHGLTVIRPLLSSSRKDIEEYLSCLSVEYRTDETNLLDDYSRNYIRHNIMPAIYERFGDVTAERISIAADILREVSDSLDSFADSFLVDNLTLNTSGTRRITLSLKPLRALPAGMRKTVILRALEEYYPGRQNLTSAHINTLDHICCCGDGRNYLDLPGGLRASREYDTLIIEHSTGRTIQPGESSQTACKDRIPSGTQSPAPVYRLPIPSDDNVICTNIPGIGRVFLGKNASSPVACTVALEYDKIVKGLCFRTRRDDDLLRITADGTKCKTLRRLMTDMKIPAAVRDSIYMLAFDDDPHILWIPELRRADRVLNAEGRSVERLTIWIEPDM